MSAAWSLLQSIFAALKTDAALTALLAADSIFCDVPQGTPLPYVTFGQASQRDWSMGTEKSSELVFTLHVWSAARGKKQAHEILGGVRVVLHDRPLSLVGHSLINLRTFDGETIHGLARLRAVTEPA